MSNKLSSVAKFTIIAGVILFTVMGINFAPSFASAGKTKQTARSAAKDATVESAKSATQATNVSNSGSSVPVPEPLTISGSLAALAMGWQLKRKMKEKESLPK